MNTQNNRNSQFIEVDLREMPSMIQNSSFYRTLLEKAEDNDDYLISIDKRYYRENDDIFGLQDVIQLLNMYIYWEMDEVPNKDRLFRFVEFSSEKILKFLVYEFEFPEIYKIIYPYINVDTDELWLMVFKFHLANNKLFDESMKYAMPKTWYDYGLNNRQRLYGKLSKQDRENQFIQGLFRSTNLEGEYEWQYFITPTNVVHYILQLRLECTNLYEKSAFYFYLTTHFEKDIVESGEGYDESVTYLFDPIAFAKETKIPRIDFGIYRNNVSFSYEIAADYSRYEDEVYDEVDEVIQLDEFNTHKVKEKIQKILSLLSDHPKSIKGLEKFDKN